MLDDLACKFRRNVEKTIVEKKQTQTKETGSKQQITSW